MESLDSFTNNYQNEEKVIILTSCNNLANLTGTVKETPVRMLPDLKDE